MKLKSLGNLITLFTKNIFERVNFKKNQKKTRKRERKWKKVLNIYHMLMMTKSMR